MPNDKKRNATKICQYFHGCCTDRGIGQNMHNWHPFTAARMHVFSCEEMSNYTKLFSFYFMPATATATATRFINVGLWTLD